MSFKLYSARVRKLDGARTAVDVVTVGEEKHYFIDSNSEAILALMD
jgi:hypothetical protein